MTREMSPEEFLEAEIESGLAPFRAQGYSPALLEEMERVLRLALTSHPTGRRLMSRARPRAVQVSGTVEPEHTAAAKTGGSR